MFFFPFMKIGFGSDYLSVLMEPIEMTGRELIFGIDDKGDAENSLTNTRVMLAGILAVLALFLPRGSAVSSGISAAFLGLFMLNAENSYTLNKKSIKEWDGLIKLEFQPALYVCLILLICATVLSAIDQSKRKKMYQDEQTSSFNLGGYM
jgi:hypothetical protein